MSRKIEVGDIVQVPKGSFGTVTMTIAIPGSGKTYQVENGKDVLGYYYVYAELTKAKKCDMCGEYFTGEVYTPVDENFRPQKGLISCGCDMDLPYGAEQHP